jgi:hypothetical protein
VTLDDIRKDIAAALEDDKRATSGPWCCERGGVVMVNSVIEDVVIGSMRLPKDGRFSAASRTREPRLARALQAVLDALDEVSCPDPMENFDYAPSVVASIRAAIARSLTKEP